MKKIILLALVLTTLSASAQVDSSLLRSGKLSLRMNDWEFVTTFIAFSPVYEDLYDSIKNRIRPLSNAQYPTGTTIVTVDSVSNGELNALAYAMKNSYNRAALSAVDRIVTAIRAINSNYVNSRQDIWDADDANIFQAKRAEGKQRLRKKPN